MHLEIFVSKILTHASMILQNYQNLIKMTSNMIYIITFGGGFKCPHKIHLNKQCPPILVDPIPTRAGSRLCPLHF